MYGAGKLAELLICSYPPREAFLGFTPAVVAESTWVWRLSYWEECLEEAEGGLTAPMTGTLDFLRGGLAPNSGSTITREGGPRDCLRELLDVEKRCLEAIYTVKSSTESCSEPYAC